MNKVRSQHIAVGDVVSLVDRLDGHVDCLKVTAKSTSHNGVFLTFEDGRESQFDADYRLEVTRG